MQLEGRAGGPPGCPSIDAIGRLMGVVLSAARGEPFTRNTRVETDQSV
jgi:hypothetical protein